MQFFQYRLSLGISRCSAIEYFQVLVETAVQIFCIYYTGINFCNIWVNIVRYIVGTATTFCPAL